MITAQYNYYISNKGPFKECNKEEHVAVTGLLLLLMLPVPKQTVQYNVLSNVKHWTGQTQTVAPSINVQ
jgi:hypothetical protein